MISELDLPREALAVRQPWAWAIIHGGKDIENRSIDAIAKGGMEPGRIAIHASKGMTRDEYYGAAEFMRAVCGVICPPAAELLRGGLIGAVTVVEIVKESPSPWFSEQRRGRGLRLADPEECSFVPSFGELGFYRWERDGTRGPSAPAQWMVGGARRGTRKAAVADVIPLPAILHSAPLRLLLFTHPVCSCYFQRVVKAR